MDNEMNDIDTSNESFDDIDSIIDKMNLNSVSNQEQLNILNNNIHRINKYISNPFISVMTLELEILIKDLHNINDIYIQQISWNPEVYSNENNDLVAFDEKQIEIIKTIGPLLEQCIQKTLVIIYTPTNTWNIQNVYEILYISKQIYTLILQII